MLGDPIHVPEVTSNGTGDFKATVPLAIWPSGTHRRITAEPPPMPCSKCAELLKALKMARDYSPDYGLSYEILDNAISKAERK